MGINFNQLKVCGNRCLQVVIRKRFQQTSAFSSKSKSESPYLFFPYENFPDYHCFYSLKDREIIWEKRKTIFPWQKELLLPDDAIFLNSTRGWLAYIHPRTAGLCLLNPFFPSPSSAVIRLPLLETFPHVVGMRIHKYFSCLSPGPGLTREFIIKERAGCVRPEYGMVPTDFTHVAISKIILCSPSTSQDNLDGSVVLAQQYYSGTPLVCKLGDSAWTNLTNLQEERELIHIVFSSEHQKCFVLSRDRSSFMTCVHEETQLHVLDPFHPSTSTIDRVGRSFDAPDNMYLLRSYLVESAGEILLVRKLMRDCSKKTVEFDVYKLNTDKGGFEPLRYLGDEALFVSSTSSDAFSLSTREFPYLKKNSIYFATCKEVFRGRDFGISNTANRNPNCMLDGYSVEGKDFGIFNLGNGSIEMFSVCDKKSSAACWVSLNTSFE